MNERKCDDCDYIIIIPNDVMEDEVIDCPCCGLEYEYKKGELIQLTLDGLDFGE